MTLFSLLAKLSTVKAAVDDSINKTLKPQLEKITMALADIQAAIESNTAALQSQSQVLANINADITTLLGKADQLAQANATLQAELDAALAGQSVPQSLADAIVANTAATNDVVSAAQAIDQRVA